MSAPARLPAAVNVNGVSRTTSAIPMHRVAFTPETTTDPVKLARQLVELEKSVYDATRHARSNPDSKGVDFEDVAAGMGGTKLYIRHNLGRFVRWRVVDWAGSATTAGPSLVCDRLDATPETTPNVLALRSYVAGTVTIRVYEVP